MTGKTRSFAELVEQIGRIGVAARDGLGLPHASHALIVAPNCIEYLEIVLGLAEAGIAVATISPQSTPAEIAYVAQDVDARLIVAHPASIEAVMAADLPTDVPVVEIGDNLSALLAKVGDSTRRWKTTETDIFCIPYTSGTTGKPKGVLLPHRARVMMMLFAMGGNYGTHNPSCRGLAMSPFFNGGGLAHLLAPIFFGGSVHILPRFRAEDLVEAVERHSINFMSMVPTQLQALFALGRRFETADMSSVKALISNASLLPQAMKERIVGRFGTGKLFDSYGATELGIVANLRPTDILAKDKCIGLPVPGAEVRLLDKEGSDVAAGEVGEIYCRSPWLFSGYWNRPEETARAFRDGWASVGDLARRDDEGYLYLVDRLKNVIISGGQNIFPAEIEQALYHHPAIAEAAIIGVDDDYWGEAVNAVVALKSGAHADAEELHAFLAKSLARYKLPKAIHFRNELPKNGMGKIMHRSLREEFAHARGGK